MDQIGNLLDRPRLYCNIDGLVELGGSLMCLGYALLLWVLVRSPQNSVWHQISLLGFIGLMLAIHYGTKSIKTYITYPRTGFVEYLKGDRRRTSIIAAMLGALIPLGLFVAGQRHSDITTAVSVSGLAFAAAYAYGIARAVRWKWIVVCAIGLGSLVITFIPADVLGALANDSLVTHPVRAKLVGAILVSLVTYGTMLLISGGVSFWLYLRHTQTPAQESQ